MAVSSRKHLFHLVQPSPWPLLIAISIAFMLSGLSFYMHHIMYGGHMLLLGLINTLLIAYF
jgi:hypothetical protein